jgi:protein O-GlcNAc transferase
MTALSTATSSTLLETSRAAFEAGDWSAAEAGCRELIRHQPGNPDGIHLLARVLHQTGQLALALALARKAVALRPTHASFHASLGATLLALGRYSDATASLERSIELDPSAPRPHKLLGILLREQGYASEAVAEFTRVLELRPDDVTGHLQLGAVLRDLGQRDAALASLKRALDLDPAAAEAHVKIGNVLMDKGLPAESVASFERAVRLGTELPYGHSNLVFALHYAPDQDGPSLRSQAEAWAARYAPAVPLTPPARATMGDADRPLRIGYVSADFMRHPVGYFIKSVFAAHDRSQVEVFCYSNNLRGDSLTQELASLADHWRIIAASADSPAAEAIRRDHIDIMVDLSGHTAGHRLPLFAHRLAPVQVSWLGYFGTTGLSAIDYILVDSTVCPPGDEDHFTETPVRLPGCYLCYPPPETLPPVEALPAVQRGYITFACFNRISKITPRVIALWSEILCRVPTARLCLKDAAFEDGDVRDRFLAAFADRDIRADRIDLLERSAHSAYLAAYNDVDIALDPFPFNGATTTAEALSMGVPVLTLRGDRFVSRMGASLLGAAGFPEFIADSADAYADIAVALAGEVPRLVEVRAGLRARLARSLLGDAASFTRDLERAYRAMWHTWCAGVAQ